MTPHGSLSVFSRVMIQHCRVMCECEIMCLSTTSSRSHMLAYSLTCNRSISINALIIVALGTWRISTRTYLPRLPNNLGHISSTAARLHWGCIPQHHIHLPMIVFSISRGCVSSLTPSSLTRYQSSQGPILSLSRFAKPCLFHLAPRTNSEVGRHHKSTSFLRGIYA